MAEPGYGHADPRRGHEAQSPGSSGRDAASAVSHAFQGRVHERVAPVRPPFRAGHDMRGIALFASAFLLVSLPASAFVTGNDLLGWCEGPGKVDEQCRFYIIGVADAHAADAVAHGFARGFCIPSEVKASQLQLVVSKWLKEHGKDLHFGAASLLLAALRDTFPCEKR